MNGTSFRAFISTFSFLLFFWRNLFFCTKRNIIIWRDFSLTALRDNCNVVFIFFNYCNVTSICLSGYWSHDGIAISVWHDLEFSISKFSLSTSSISLLVWIASSIVWRLVEQLCLLSVVFLHWVAFVYENMVFTAFSVKSLLADIPSNSSIFNSDT